MQDTNQQRIIFKRRRLVSTALGALGADVVFIAFHAKFAQNLMPMTANLKNLSKEPGDAW